MRAASIVFFAYIGSEAVSTAGQESKDPAKDMPFGPPNVGLSTVMTAIGVLVVAGVLAGIMPASHAASIKPIEALRAE